ncbi:hypothetical protein ND747_13555, partial [Frankia sp. R82]|nr:hypothetical protein [Frankia sp. R82]
GRPAAPGVPAAGRRPPVGTPPPTFPVRAAVAHPRRSSEDAAPAHASGRPQARVSAVASGPDHQRSVLGDDGIGLDVLLAARRDLDARAEDLRRQADRLRRATRRVLAQDTAT